MQVPCMTALHSMNRANCRRAVQTPRLYLCLALALALLMPCPRALPFTTQVLLLEAVLTVLTVGSCFGTDTGIDLSAGHVALCSPSAAPPGRGRLGAPALACPYQVCLPSWLVSDPPRMEQSVAGMV